MQECNQWPMMLSGSFSIVFWTVQILSLPVPVNLKITHVHQGTHLKASMAEYCLPGISRTDLI
jgi:hypothetical protein